MTPPRHLTVILKALDMCNGACTFCSVGQAGRALMNPEDFEIFASRLGQYIRELGIGYLTFTFHGGEPSLLGADWIDRACRRVRKLAPRVDFNMQSNLLDFPDALVAVAREHEIKIGSSIDPLAGERRDCDGHDAFPRWLWGWRKLCEAGFTVGSIFVVTRASLGRSAALYRIAESLNAFGGSVTGLQVNPVYPQGRASCEDGMLVEPAEFGTFLVEMWKQWELSGRSVRLTPIQGFARFLDPGSGNRRHQLTCSFSGACAGSHLGVNHDLRLAGCGRRLDSGSFYGSLRDASIADLVDRSEEHARIASRSDDLRLGQCAGCGHFAICHGGCPDDAGLAFGDPTRRFQWCESFRMLFDAMASHYPGAGMRRVPEPRIPPLPRPIVTLEAAIDPREILPREDGSRLHDRWILPGRGSRALGFDSGLDALLADGTGGLRVWVTARAARSLAMWEDLVADPRTQVVLSDPEGLAATLNLLNALRATVLLDVPAILGSPGGLAALDAALGRYLTDPLWRSQVQPFAGMLSCAVHGRVAPLQSRWGLEPGCVRLAASPGTDGDPLAACIVREMEHVGQVHPASWMMARRPCLECDHMRICGACLAAGDGATCGTEAMSLVSRIASTAAQIRVDLEPGEGG